MITMADRYQDKLSPAPAKGESDPLAELARLIGQTDPFSNFGRANQPMPPRDTEPYRRPEPEAEPEIDEALPAGPPSWMHRPAQQEAPPQQDFFDTSVHPLRRYAAAHPPAEPEYHEAPPFAADADQHGQADPTRYDHALYGEPDPGTYAAEPRDAAYADDPYAYQDGYADEAEHDAKPRRGGMMTVAAVLALAVVGTGGAFAYRTYMGSPRSGEPPIIHADAGPTKVVPAPSPAANANASANAPLSLSPQAGQPAPAEPRPRVASTSPAQAVSSGAAGYVVQVSSQRSEADAQASYRALQGKFPSVLGSRAPLIKRADLGDKGVYYRAMVGPFASSEEAAQVCGNLKTAGGQCVVQKN